MENDPTNDSSQLHARSLLEELSSQVPGFVEKLQAEVKNLPKNVSEEDVVADESDPLYPSSDEDPEEQYIKDMNARDELGWPPNEETPSPKGMDKAEERAGLRDPD